MSGTYAKFCLISTGTYCYAELDGKTIGEGMKELKFCTHDENGEMRNQLELKIDLKDFHFMEDDKFDEAYQKLHETVDETASDED